MNDILACQTYLDLGKNNEKLEWIEKFGVAQSHKAFIAPKTVLVEQNTLLLATPGEK